MNSNNIQQRLQSIKVMVDEMIVQKEQETLEIDLLLDINNRMPYENLEVLPDNQLIEISTGVMIRKYVLLDGRIGLDCSMIKGSIYETHTHTDFYEYMFFRSGKVLELQEQKIYESGDYHILEKGEWHGFKALEDVWMSIICSRTQIHKNRMSKMFNK